LRLLAVIALGLAAAASSRATPSTPTAILDQSPVPSRAPLSDEPDMALRQLGSLVPIGTPQNEAVWTLQNQGFAVLIVHGFFGSESFPKYLYCDYRRWQVAVVIVNGRISDYRVVVGT
jgi:hypothetical protein